MLLDINDKYKKKIYKIIQTNSITNIYIKNDQTLIIIKKIKNQNKKLNNRKSFNIRSQVF